jgi:hypothetical protein
MRRCIPWIGIYVLLNLFGCAKETERRVPGSQNHPPQITSVTVRPNRVLALHQVYVLCIARDVEDTYLKFRWQATAGDFPAGNQLPGVTWKSPPTLGSQTLKVWVTDYKDTVSTEIVVEVSRVASPDTLAFSNGINVVSLKWPGVADSTIDGWSGYEVYLAPRSMVGMSEQDLSAYRITSSPTPWLTYRISPLEPGNVVYCQVRSRRDYLGIVERAASGPEIETAVRPDGFASDPHSGETTPLYEVKSRRGAFGLHLPGGEIEPLDPSQRDQFDLYVGSSGPEDGPGTLQLKSPSGLSYADPAWSGRVTGFWRLDGDWSTPIPPENPPLESSVPVVLNAVYGLYTADGHFAKIWVLPDDRTGIYPNRRVWIKWAWQPIPGYPRF